MPHSHSTSAAASPGIRLNALIESALLEADPEHYGPSPPQSSVGPSGTSSKRASPMGPAAPPPEVLVRPATNPTTGPVTTPASDSSDSSWLGHAKVTFNIPSEGSGPAAVSPPHVNESHESLSGVSSPRRQRITPPSKLAHSSDLMDVLNDSSGSHASLDAITSERDMTTPTPPPTAAFMGRPQAGGAGGATAGRGRTGARLAQPPGTASGAVSSKHKHTVTPAPSTASGAGGGPTSNLRTTAASTLLARTRSNSRHRQPSTESTGSMDRGLDSNATASNDAIFGGGATPAGIGSSRISQLAPTLAERARLARVELAELQSEASAAMRELEAAEAMRKEAEVARLQSERDVESVQRRIEMALKKRDELEELLEGLRAENDELERQLAVSGGFLNRYAGYVDGAADKGKESKEGARTRTASSNGVGVSGGTGAGMGAAGV